MEDDSHSIEQKPLSELIADRLKRRIWNREVEFGERLLESDLAAQFDVSRSTVREALKILENEELIISKARKGTYVAEFSKKDRKDIIELRTLLEIHAFQRALEHIKASHLKDLEAIISKMEEQTEKKSWNDLFDLDMEFHSYVVHLCGNDRLIKMYNSIQVQIRTFLVHLDQYYSSFEAFCREHKDLLDALRSKQQEVVTQQVKNHIEFVEEELLDVKENKAINKKEEAR